MPLVIPSRKIAMSDCCPECGGPAEVDLFWSTSPQEPGLKTLKKQICCGGRPGRNSRHRPTPAPRCPVQVVVVETHALTTECPSLPPESGPLCDLDAAIEFLAGLSHEECLQLVELARLSGEFTRRKAALTDRLKRG